MVDIQAIGLGGAFAGVFLNTILHYIRAREQAEDADPSKPLEFDRKFLITAITAAGTGGATSILIFPNLLEILPKDATTLFAFMTGAGIGYSFNNGINMIVSTGANTIRASKEKIVHLKELAKIPITDLKEAVKTIKKD